jgi:hypothetical protein
MSLLTETCRPKSAPQFVDVREVRRAEKDAREWNRVMRSGARIWCQEHGAEGIVRSPAWEHNAEPVVTVEIDGREMVVSIRRVHGVS